MNTKVLKKVVAGLVLLCLLSILALYFWFNSDTFYVNTVDMQSYTDVAFSFTIALRENKVVKPLVAPEL